MKSLLRPAVAMIELIFAIVVMGIALMSAPMLISTATQSSFVAIQQEAISEAASHLNMVMGYHWDEGDANDLYLDPILIVGGGDSNLSQVGTTGKRYGTPKESRRSFIREDGNKSIFATVPASLGSDPVETSEDDVDDFIGDHDLILIESASADYVEGAGDIKISTTVTYINDTPGDGTYENPGTNKKLTFSTFTTNPANSTNIKRIVVKLTDESDVEELNKTIVLQAFTCNIGGYELETKAF
jgi:hypothetical protein